LSNGIIDKRGTNIFEESFNDQSDEESQTSTKDEAANQLVLENEDISEQNDKERENEDNSSDEVKDDEQLNCIEKQDHELEVETIETSQSDLLAVSIETSNGVDCVNDNLNEDLNDVENDNQSPERYL